jgi:NRPS condensation-like uncharacterized protein
MNYISRGIADQQLHFVIRCAAQLDEGRLRKAVDLCVVAHPVLGCLLDETGKEPFWRPVDRSEGWGFSVAEGSDIDKQLNDFILVPGDPRKDPLAQVRLFRGMKDTLCVKMNHVCADGAGTRNYAYLLVSIYNALGRDPGFVPKIDERERSMRSVLNKYGLGMRIGLARAAMRFMRKANTQVGRSWQLPVKSSSNTRRTMAVRRIDEAWGIRITDIAKQHDATLNDMLLAAYFRTLFKIIPVDGSAPVPLQVSVDLRRYNPVTTDVIGNLSSAIFAAIPPTSAEEFFKTLERVKEVMNRQKARSPLVGAYAIGIPFRFMNYPKASAAMQQMTAGRANKGVAMPLLSNFGKLEPERLAFDGSDPTDAYITTPIMFPPYLMLGVTGYRGSLTLTSGYCRDGVGNDSVERILDLVLEELPGK